MNNSQLSGKESFNLNSLEKFVLNADLELMYKGLLVILSVLVSFSADAAASSNAVCIENTLRAAVAADENSTVPKTAATVNFQTGPDKTQTVSVTIPSVVPGQAAIQVQLGKLSVLKAGTRVYRWGSSNVDEALTSQRFTDQQILQEVVHSAELRDHFGGGLYISTNPIDSSQFGPHGLTFVLQSDLKAVVSPVDIPSVHAADILLALRESGIDAIQAGGKPTWYNIIHAKGLDTALERVTVETILASAKNNADPVEALAEFAVFDFKDPVQMSDWPDDFFQNIKKIAMGQAKPTHDDDVFLSQVYQKAYFFIAGGYNTRALPPGTSSTPPLTQLLFDANGRITSTP